MLKSLHLLALSFLLISLVSCANLSTGDNFPTDATEQVEVGMTTAEVIEIMGQPYTTERYSDEERWIWVYATRRQTRSFVVIIKEDEVTSFSSYREAFN